MSDWPIWVLSVAIAIGVVLIGLLVFLIVHSNRKGKGSSDSLDSRSTSKSGAIEAQVSQPQASAEAKESSLDDAEPEFRTPTVPASQAIGLGWAKASDLAHQEPQVASYFPYGTLEPDENPNT